MPIYDYACRCGKTFEVLILKKSDEKEVRCPACEGTQVERLMSATHKKLGHFHEYRWPDKKVR